LALLIPIEIELPTGNLVLKLDIKMSERYIFHLAFPVNDLQQVKEFYRGILDAKIGREYTD